MSSQRSSWLEVSPSSHFSLANIPFGIISTSADSTPRPAVAIGDHALDLKVFSQEKGFSGEQKLQDKLADVFSQPTLNAFAALGRPFHREVRAYLQDILAADTKQPQLLKDNAALREKAILSLSDVTNHVPMAIGDYTDFYVGKHHAFNIGVLFRGAANALQPNYTHLPVAYHGRASSIVVSGTPIRRPWGQVLLDPKAEPKVPTFTPSKKLDLELELGMFVCGANELGRPINVRDAEDYIFGYVLLNDWSARDVQAWEYVPLGPFTSKNLGSSISPWIVLADALQGHKTKGIENDTKYAKYLEQPADVKEKNVLGIDLEVELISEFFLVAHLRAGLLTRAEKPPAATGGSSARQTRGTCSGRGPRWSRTTPSRAATCRRATCSGPAPSRAPTPGRRAACSSRPAAARRRSRLAAARRGSSSRTATRWSFAARRGRRARSSASARSRAGSSPRCRRVRLTS